MKSIGKQLNTFPVTFVVLSFLDFFFALRPRSLYMLSDAGKAGDQDTYSTTGYRAFFGANPISWMVAKQEKQWPEALPTLSTVRWLRQPPEWFQHLLTEPGLAVPDSLTLFCDNIEATYSSSNPVLHSRIVRDLVEEGILRVSHIASQDQLADALTKQLSSIQFCQFRTKMEVADAGAY